MIRYRATFRGISSDEMIKAMMRASLRRAKYSHRKRLVTSVFGWCYILDCCLGFRIERPDLAVCDVTAVRK